MSSNSVDVSNLVQAVAEDPRLKPMEKETIVKWTKDGSPTTAATQFDQHVAHILTEEAGMSRRLLQHPHFTVTEIYVNNSKGAGQRIEPDNFAGGRVSGVKGYIPIGALKVQASVRSTSGHANVVAYQRSASNSAQSPTSPTSGDVTEERVGMDNSDDSDDDFDEESDYKVTDPLDW